MKRTTAQKNAIMEVFQQLDRPLGIEDILRKGREKVPSLNRVTVYRNIKSFLEGGLLLKINHPTLGNLYERAEKEHHHHFHCRICDQVFEVPCCALKEIDATPEGFFAESHEVFVSGVCSSCSTRGFPL
ncbi:MAG TPA: transcriptional repressor [Syntrophorhabdaceae bacterium]|nr:transcriptional repressor [Syntrophorhabdaceae bacterium]